jgi:hypothetical protein
MANGAGCSGHHQNVACFLPSGEPLVGGKQGIQA